MLPKGFSSPVSYVIQLVGLRARASVGDDTADRSNEMRRRARLTSVTNVAARSLSFGVVLISARVALPDLGPTRFGIWMTAASLLILLSFLDLGVGNGLVAPIAKAKARGEAKLVVALATRGLALTCGIGLIIASLATLASMTAPLEWLFPGTDAVTQAEARQALIVFSILIGTAPPLGAVNRIFAGLQRGYISNLATALAAIATIGLLVGAGTIGGQSISTYILLTFGLAQLATLLTGIILWREGTFSASAVRRSGWGDYRQLLATGGLFLGLQIAVMLGWGLDQTLISAIQGPSQVAAYAIALRLFMIVSQPLYILNTPLWPTYSDALARGDRVYIRTTFIQSMLRTAAIAVAGSLALLAAGPFAWGLVTQNEIPYPQTMMVAFAIFTIVDTLGTALAMYLNGTDNVKVQLQAAMLAATIAVPTKVYLIGAVGPAVAPMVTAACFGLANLLFFGLIARRRVFANLSSGRA